LLRHLICSLLKLKIIISLKGAAINKERVKWSVSEEGECSIIAYIKEAVKPVVSYNSNIRQL